PYLWQSWMPTIRSIAAISLFRKPMRWLTLLSICLMEWLESLIIAPYHHFQVLSKLLISFCQMGFTTMVVIMQLKEHPLNMDPIMAGTDHPFLPQERSASLDGI